MNQSKPSKIGWRFLVPNSFTALSAVLGLSSIVLSFDHNLEWACWFILWSVLLDKADGTAARLLNATSPFGIQFDSMADLISFGMAPACLVYATGRSLLRISSGQPLWWLLLIGCCLYALMAAIRLAKFNVSERSGGMFSGLPSTICGAIVPASVLVGLKYQASPEVFRYLPVLLCVLGVGMVSTLSVPKVTIRKNRLFNLFQLLNMVAVYICGVLMVFPEYLLTLAVVYIVVGAVWATAQHQSQQCS